MLETRSIRVLVPYSRTLFFHDRGHARGVIPVAMHELETRLNHKFKAPRPLLVTLIPTTRDRLLPDLEAGVGDVAAGDITIKERARRVAFTLPTIEKVSEVFVTGPTLAQPLSSVDDLAGREVHVRPTTSYRESLLALNQRFWREGTYP